VTLYTPFSNVLLLRAFASGLSTLLCVLICGRWWINASRTFLRSNVRPDTPLSHQSKNNTPTMGGLLLLGAIFLNLFIWASTYNVYVVIICTGTFLFGLLGAWDDWSKIAYCMGISAKAKFILQCICGAITIILWFLLAHPASAIIIPTVNWNIPMHSALFFNWALFVLIGTSNAVNLTDGLDGLVAGCLIPAFVCATCLVYWSAPAATHGSMVDVAELVIVGTTMIGALLGFIWYNRYPAQFFMGDVGSLAFGAALALMMLTVHAEVILIATGIVFVVETVSVIVQIFWYKKYRTRLLKRAPLHHHFELCGWHETSITLLFSIIACCTCIATLFVVWRTKA
jgi:phospho-N-acetylmuramoyl-pentapeptide-transferase